MAPSTDDTMSKSSTPMSELQSTPFRCIHCAHELASAQHVTTEFTCPLCNKATDPYNPRARTVQRQSYLIILISVSIAALIPGIGIGVTSIMSPLLFILLWPTLIVPSFLSDRFLKRTPFNQRPAVCAVLWIAWLSGIPLGYLATIAVYDLI